MPNTRNILNVILDMKGMGTRKEQCVFVFFFFSVKHTCRVAIHTYRSTYFICIHECPYAHMYIYIYVCFSFTQYLSSFFPNSLSQNDLDFSCVFFLFFSFSVVLICSAVLIKEVKEETTLFAQ